MNTYRSGATVNISCSSFRICSSVLAFLSSDSDGGGSNPDAIRSDLARAREARLNHISISEGVEV